MQQMSLWVKKIWGKVVRTAPKKSFYSVYPMKAVVAYATSKRLPEARKLRGVMLTIDTFQNYVIVIATTFCHFEWGH